MDAFLVFVLLIASLYSFNAALVLCGTDFRRSWKESRRFEKEHRLIRNSSRSSTAYTTSRLFYGMFPKIYSSLAARVTSYRRCFFASVVVIALGPLLWLLGSSTRGFFRSEFLGPAILDLVTDLSAIRSDLDFAKFPWRYVGNRYDILTPRDTIYAVDDQYYFDNTRTGKNSIRLDDFEEMTCLEEFEGEDAFGDIKTLIRMRVWLAENEKSPETSTYYVHLTCRRPRIFRQYYGLHFLQLLVFFILIGIVALKISEFSFSWSTVSEEEIQNMVSFISALTSTSHHELTLNDLYDSLEIFGNEIQEAEDCDEFVSVSSVMITSRWIMFRDLSAMCFIGDDCNVDISLQGLNYRRIRVLRICYLPTNSNIPFHYHSHEPFSSFDRREILEILDGLCQMAPGLSDKIERVRHEFLSFLTSSSSLVSPSPTPSAPLSPFSAYQRSLIVHNQRQEPHHQQIRGVWEALVSALRTQEQTVMMNDQRKRRLEQLKWEVMIEGDDLYEDEDEDGIEKERLETCTICYVDDCRYLVSLKCGEDGSVNHVLCFECANRLEKNVCPFCRKEIAIERMEVVDVVSTEIIREDN